MTILHSLCFEIYRHIALSISLTLICLKITLCNLLFWRRFCQKRVVYYLLAQEESMSGPCSKNKQTNKKPQSISIPRSCHIHHRVFHSQLPMCINKSLVCSTHHSVQYIPLSSAILGKEAH